MKYTVPFRVIVRNPPSGAVMKVQNGKTDLLEPRANGNVLIFEFELNVDLTSEKPNFLGPFAQGPKDARFIYVNSGTYAGQAIAYWSRRAKLSLMSISRKEIEQVLKSAGARIETEINGTGSDGGPVCATIKGLEWRVVR